MIKKKFTTANETKKNLTVTVTIIEYPKVFSMDFISGINQAYGNVFVLLNQITMWIV